MTVEEDSLMQTDSLSPETSAVQEESKVTNLGEGRGSKKPSSSDMLFYYERVLPFKTIFQWLNHSPKVGKDFTMREFAFEFRSGAYQRYNSFNSHEDFKKSVVNANPTRFEVGAVYSVNPKERKNLPKSALRPLSKELVFDIDLTDYDDIRRCCQKTDICTKCWKFIQVAAKVLNAALADDFGFEHFIWVFSGRRGAHCWVSDRSARDLDETTRKSIIDYLDLLNAKKNKRGSTTLNLKRPFHPHVERSFDILKQHFVDIILEDQDLWLTTPETSPDSKEWESVEELLSFLPEASLREELSQKWKTQVSVSTSKQKWEDINSVAKKILKHQNQVNLLNEAKKDIIVYFLYPRLDAEVTKQLIHLLKSPFCIHPATGNICVPFDPLQNLSDNREDDEYGFNPTTVPSLSLIQTEIEIWDTKRINKGSSQQYEESDSDIENRRVLDFEKTSLKPYVEYFTNYTSKLLKAELKGTSKRDREELDF